ncbi:T9SS type A sorting domain-containing protein [Chryseobacterium tongliaoense]|uniref:T9SS type A sorting domain-containing protein n=1 Tax=Chryseobacterium tongliaoense TaxID=3240933 RepID=UPI003512F8C3
MKKIYLLTLLLLFAFFTNAQVTVQGVPRNDIKEKPAKKHQLKNAATVTNFSDIQYWVGTGTNQAAFVVQWNDNKNPDALVWGFKWNGTATGEDMMKAIAKADHRLFTLLYQGTQFGTAVGGLGYDLNGQGTNTLYKNGNTTSPLYPVNGIVNTTAYNFDDYTAADTNDHWQSGWNTGYWSYWVKDPADTGFGYSGVGVSSRVLQNGSWDAWNFNPGMNSVPLSSTLTPATLSSALSYSSLTNFTDGYFMVNEEWFGHTNGSVNFIGNNGQIDYRVYSNVNNNHAFGATTQYGTIYGDKFYFISKQAADGGDTQYTPGGRLVVANAATMQKIATFNSIGGGDGRSFVGVNAHKGYIGTSNGIYLFDIDNLQVGNLIPTTGGGSQYAGQIGNMIRTSQYVFAVKQSTGILVINPNTSAVTHTISGGFHSITQAKDGSVWAIQDQKVVNINPVTFATTEYPIPVTKYLGSWGAWNAGSFTYSSQQNALYWLNSINSFVSGAQIIKFDVTTKTFNENFAVLPGQTGTYKQIPYGAALRVNPVTDEIIVNTTESGFGAHYQKNWIHTFSNTGTLINTKTLVDYYWFPALAVFPDNSAPVVSSAFPSEAAVDATTVIDLKTVVSDADNLSSAIVKTVQSNTNPSIVSAEINANDELVLTPQATGTATVTVSFNSNGKLVEKSLTVNASVSTLSTVEVKKLEFSIYPNPATEILNIRTQDKVSGITVYDASGKLINAQFSNGQINVSMLPKGMYILRAVTDKAVYQQKFIKN